MRSKQSASLQALVVGSARPVRGPLAYCADYRCGHSIAISGDSWPDDARLSDIEARFVCQACGKRGADVRPDFNWGKPASPPVKAWGIVEVPGGVIILCHSAPKLKIPAGEQVSEGTTRGVR